MVRLGRSGALRIPLPRPAVASATSRPNLSGSEEVSPPPRPPETVRAPFNAHGSSKPGWSLSLPLPCRASSRHWISPPMICSPYGPAHPHLIHALQCYAQGRFTCSTSAPFHVGYGPIQRVMYSPCLSAVGLRFLEHPTPIEELAIPCGLGTDCSDLVGGFLFRIGDIQPGWEPAIPRSLWCVPSDV